MAYQALAAYSLCIKYVFLIEDSNSAAEKLNIKCQTILPSLLITTPHQASTEFGILLSNIIKELKCNEEENLETIKNVCSCLTIKDDPNTLLFNEQQQEKIEACNSIRIMLTKNLRRCWRWDDFSLLKTLVQSLETSDHCKNLLTQYEQKLDSQMKLHEICQYCMTQKQDIPKGYDKMVAILQNKIFYHITKEEYDEIKQFIVQHCGVNSYVILPLHKAAVSSLLLEFIIPLTAVSHMVKIALQKAEEFMKRNFVYFKISSTVVLDTRVSLYVSVRM